MGSLSSIFEAVHGRGFAVDLGTSNTVIFSRDSGVIVDEPSVAAVNTRTRELLAVGVEAKRMLGRTPGHIEAASPLRDGAIADFEMCEQMLRHFLQKAQQGVGGRWAAKPRMVIAAPYGISGVEQRAVRDAAEFAGAKGATIIEAPVAAALGAGLAIHEAVGSMVVDIGGGTTEIAIISLGGLVASKSIRVAGAQLDESIIDYTRSEYGLDIGASTAEIIKLKMGSACHLVQEVNAEIGGRDLVTGLPKKVMTSTQDVREALAAPLQKIFSAIKSTLDAAPAELAADIAKSGITLVGGGALLNGFSDRLNLETGISVKTPKQPRHMVALGSGRYLDAIKSHPASSLKAG